MPASKLDRLFGGQPGAAERYRQSARKAYGPKDGEEQFRSVVRRRELKAKRAKRGR